MVRVSLTENQQKARKEHFPVSQKIEGVAGEEKNGRKKHFEAAEAETEAEREMAAFRRRNNQELH